MGFSTQHLVKEQTKMIKAILIASLATVALAEAEADPYVYSGLGGYYGGHLGYTGLGHLGYGYGLGYGHGLVYGKRSAEADPYYGYGYGLGYAGHHLGYAGDRGLGYRGYAGHHLGYAGYRGLGYRGYAGYPRLGYYGGLGYYGKRSADAEPEAKADPYLLYSGLGYTGYGLGHHLGFAGHLGYGYGLGYRAGCYYGK